VRLARAPLRQVSNQLEAGNTAAADEAIREHAIVAARLRLPVFTWVVPLLRAVRAIMERRFADATAALAEAEAVPGRPSGIAAQIPLTGLRVGIGRASGRVDRDAERELTALTVHIADPWYPLALRASSAALLGDQAMLRQALEEVSPQFDAWRHRLSLAWLADAAIAANDRALAERIEPMLRPLAHRHHVWGPPMNVEGPLSEPLERLAAFLGGVAREPPASLTVPLVLTSLPVESFSLVREGELWTVSHGGRHTRLKDSRGLQLLAQLVAAPGREVHVLELLGAGDGGDAGEARDGRAFRAYGGRARDLREELDEARDRNDLGRVEVLQEELESIAQQIAHGVGIGGKARREGSSAERARVNVRRRLVLVIDRISVDLPALGRHLMRAVRTGLICVYRPDDQ